MKKPMKLIIMLCVVSIISFSGIEDITFDLGSYSRACTGVANSSILYAALTNPAILGSEKGHNGWAIENSPWLMGTVIQNFAYTSDISFFTYSFGISRLIDEEGMTYTDVSGNSKGIIKYEEYSIYEAVGVEIATGFCMGVTFKANNLNAITHKQNYSMDMGLYYDNQRFWKAGIKLQNLYASSEKNDKRGYYLIGLTLYDDSLFWDIEYNNSINKIGMGIGYTNNVFTVSAGMDGNNNFSAGVKVSLWGLNLEYAYKSIEYLGAINRFGFALEL